MENKYYIDDFYMNGIVRPTMGPIADATLWVDMNVVDAVPNLGAGVAKYAAAAVAVIDDNAVDGVYNLTGAGTGATGSFLRQFFPGQVQQYVALSFAGVVIFAALFVIF